MIPFGLIPAGESPVDLAWVTFANASANSLTLPSAIQPGDFLFWFGRGWNNSGTPAAITPDGFTLVTNYTQSVGRVITAWKIAGASDPGRTVTGVSGTFRVDNIVGVLRPNRSIKSVTLVAQSVSLVEAATASTAGISKTGLVLAGGAHGGQSPNLTLTPDNDLIAGSGRSQIGFRVLPPGTAGASYSAQVSQASSSARALNIFDLD